MGPIGSEHDLSAQQKKTLAKVKTAWDAGEKLHRQLRPRWEVFYGLSRNYRKLQSAFAQATNSRDRDTVMDEFRRVFGTDLFIPYVFTVIETNIPRIFSSTPQMSVLPLEEDAVLACGRLKHLYKRDADKINYETTLQEVARSGLRYGLGVQKTHWGEDYKTRPVVESRLLGLGSKTEMKKQLVHAGPQAEAWDIFDLRWDPAAKNIETAGYVIFRSWRSTEYVKERVEEGRRLRLEGKTSGWVELDMEKIAALGSESGRGSVWSGRMEAAGIGEYDTGGNRLHEVWEFHDGENVYTVLDGTLPVQEARNPYFHCEIPAQIYRPTLVEHEFVGIGEVEPLAHLQYELNTMRGQRRDAATLAMQRGYFYQVGTLDPSKMLTGAGVFNAVFGDPKDVIQPMPFTDIPQSGVSEEEALKADIELTSGMSESAIGSGGESTATGTQLVQQAANLRVRQKTKNLAKQIVGPAAQQWLEMYRQHILEEGDGREVRTESPGSTEGFTFISVGPEDVQAKVEVFPDETTMEPDNPQQKRADARELATALAPFAEQLDTGALIKYLLTQYGIEAPDEWIKPPEPAGPDPEAIVSAIGESLKGAGIPDQIVEAVLEEAHSKLQAAQPEEGGGEEQKPAAPEAAATPSGGQ